MNFLRKSCFYFLLLLIFVYVVFYAFIESRGKQLAETTLTNIFGRSVLVDYVQVKPPYEVILYKVRMPGAFSVDKMEIVLALPTLMDNRLIIKELTLFNPVVRAGRTPDSKIVWGKPRRKKRLKIMPPIMSSIPLKREKPLPQPWIKKIKGVYVKYLNVYNGQAYLYDYSRAKSLSFYFENLILKSDHVFYPFEKATTKYKMRGLLSSKELPFLEKNVIEMQGKINLVKRDMEGLIKTMTKEGGLGLILNLVSYNNQMLVQGKISLGYLVLTQNAGKALGSPLEKVIISAIQKAGLKMGMEFSFKTKMDDFQITNLIFRGGVSLPQAYQKAAELLKKDMDRLRNKKEDADKKVGVVAPGSAEE